MDSKQLFIWIATVLTTALECQPCPCSSVYTALGMDFGKWETLSGIMTRSGLITIHGHSISLTPKGRELAEKINEARAAVA